MKKSITFWKYSRHSILLITNTHNYNFHTKYRGLPLVQKLIYILKKFYKKYMGLSPTDNNYILYRFNRIKRKY